MPSSYTNGFEKEASDYDYPDLYSLTAFLKNFKSEEAYDAHSNSQEDSRNFQVTTSVHGLINNNQVRLLSLPNFLFNRSSYSKFP